jgi:cytochrome c
LSASVPVLLWIGLQGRCAAEDGAVARGERAFQKCYACHSVEPGEDGLTGPDLRGVAGRPIAAASGFDYSDALRALAAEDEFWSPELLDAFLADPETFAPGTSMTFVGLRDLAERHDLIAYLESTDPAGTN